LQCAASSAEEEKGAKRNRHALMILATADFDVTQQLPDIGMMHLWKRNQSRQHLLNRAAGRDQLLRQWSRWP
jgi:hypothetical protein